MVGNHALSCSECHLGREDLPEKAGAHQGLVSNPSDFTRPHFPCGGCHQDQIRWVNRALMRTAAGIVNQTRFLWGAQPDPGARFGVVDVDNLRLLPEQEASGALVDDLLRRRCLRCHLGTSGSIASGSFPGEIPVEGAGCSACHVIRGNRGTAKEDPLPPPGTKGGGKTHQITTAIPTSQCLQCHRGNYVGSDYVGLFERDHSAAYNFDAKDTDRPPQLYSHAYHHLLPDVHHDRGIHCIDCHPVEEIMGEGSVHSHAGEQVGIRCTDCHGRPGKPPVHREVASSDQRALRAAKLNPFYDLFPGQKVLTTSKGHLLTSTFERDGEWFLLSKADGRVHRIPLLGRSPPDKTPLDHQISEHMERMECSACHGAWTFQDLGFHLVRLDRADYNPWVWLTRQGDPQVEELLEKNLLKPEDRWDPPASRDWLTVASRPGIWLAGYSLRRWEGLVLGVNERGMVSAMRPQYQYWVSWVDGQGKVLMDSVIPRAGDGRPATAWNSYTPHTIRRQTAACWDCHDNPGSLGLGQALLREKDGKTVPLTRPWEDGLGIHFELDQVIDSQGAPLQRTVRPGSRFLGEEAIPRMSPGNPRYVRDLLRYYEGKEAYGDPAGFTGPKR